MFLLLGACFANPLQETPTLKGAPDAVSSGHLRGFVAKTLEKNNSALSQLGNATEDQKKSGVLLSLQKSGIPSGAALSCPCGKRCAQIQRMTAGQFSCLRWECSKCLTMLVPQMEAGDVFDEKAGSLLSLQNMEVENATEDQKKSGTWLSLQKSGIPSGAALSCPCGKRCAQIQRMTAGQFSCLRWECSKCLTMLVPQMEAGDVFDEKAGSLLSLQNMEVENATEDQKKSGTWLSLQKSGIPSGAALSCPCGKRCAQIQRMTAGQFSCLRWECSKCLTMNVFEENAGSLLSLQNMEVENATEDQKKSGMLLSLQKSGIPSGAALSCPCGKRCAQIQRMTAGQFSCLRWECSKCLTMNVFEANAGSLLSLQNMEVENATEDQKKSGTWLSLQKSGIPSGAALSCPCGKRCAQIQRMTAGQFSCLRWECSKCLTMNVFEENAGSLLSLQNMEVENATEDQKKSGTWLSLQKSGIPSGAALSCPCGKRCAQIQRMTAGQFSCLRWECNESC